MDAKHGRYHAGAALHSTFLLPVTLLLLVLAATVARASLATNELAAISPNDAVARILADTGDAISLVPGSVQLFGSEGELTQFDQVDLGSSVTLEHGIRLTSASGLTGSSLVHDLLNAEVSKFGTSTTQLRALRFEVSVSVASGIKSITFGLIFHSEESCGASYDVAGVFVDRVNYAFLEWTTGAVDIIRVSPEAGLSTNNSPPPAFSSYGCQSETLSLTGVFDPDKTPIDGRTTHEIILAVADTADTLFPSAILVGSAVGGMTEVGGITTTPPISAPTVVTGAVTSITSTSAQIDGDVTSDGGDPVTARGIVVGTAPNPVRDASDTMTFSTSSGIGAFEEIATSLAPGTAYFARAFASNSEGTAYGDDVSFTTQGFPVITETSVTTITMTSADFSATISSSDTAVTERGFVLATTTTPIRGDEGVTDLPVGEGTGIFTATRTGLVGNTTYYVRAYAKNSAGVAYGPTQVFTSASNDISTTAGSTRWFAGPTIVDAGLSLDGESLLGATVSIDNNAVGDVLACPDATGAIECSFNAGTGVLTLTGAASAATYEAILRGVTFATTNIATNITPRTITFNLGGSLTFDPATGHYYEIVTVSAAGDPYIGGTQDPDGTKGDLNRVGAEGVAISWEEARCRAKYTNAKFGGELMTDTTRVPTRTSQANDRCVPLDGVSPLELRTINGLPGHLANITSLAEHEFLRTKLTGEGWIGGSDVDEEGVWMWMDGPEAGQVFWIQGTTTVRRGINTIDGEDRFNYWTDGEPNDAGGEHWAEFGFGESGVGSSWNDCRNSCGSGRVRYIVEYSALGGVAPPLLSASRTVIPLPAQAITFNPANELMYGSPALSLTATSSVGLTVELSITVGDGTVCTLDGTTLTWAAPGLCTIQAAQAGSDSDGGVQPAPIVTRDIMMIRRPLPIAGLTAISRVYDGTSHVAVTGTPTFDPADLITGDAGGVTAGGSPSATLPSAAAGNARVATVTDVVLSGSRAFAYEPTATLVVDIAPKSVRLAGSFLVNDRPYDGTTTVTPSSELLTLLTEDVLPADLENLALGTVTFAADTTDAGTRTATPTAASLTGARADDYVAIMTGAPTTTFTITPLTLTVVSGTFIVSDKVYDGSDTATVTSHTLELDGFAAVDSAADVDWTPVGRFIVTTAGTGRTVELVGGAVIGGTKGGGYVLDVSTAPTAAATITPRPVTVTGASATSRPYNGATAVTVSGATLVNTVPGDAVSVTNATSGVAASPNVGTHAVATSMTLSGADAANYTLSGQPSVSVTIAPLPVSVSLNALPARTYDGTTTLPLPSSAFSVSGVLAGESISVSGTGSLSSRAVGTRSVTVTPTFAPGAGTMLTNYTLPSSVSGTVTVTPATVRIVGAAVTSRMWDGSTAATVTGARLDGVRQGDAVSLAGGTSGVFTSAQPGSHAVRYSPTLVGVDAGNYTLAATELTGTITRAPATLRITGGLVQFADGSARSVRAAVSPAGAGTVQISYAGGAAPQTPGSYAVTVTLNSVTHEASPLSATLIIQPVEALLQVPAPAGTSTEPVVSSEPMSDEQRERLLARIAVRPDGTLALPVIGPVLEEDGSAPALRPNDQRVLADGEPVTARVVVVEQQRIRVETERGGYAIELQAALGDGERRIPLPVDADGTLLLDRGGFVDVGGTGFQPGSAAEVWMFSTATFLGTAIVESDGSFSGSFAVDTELEPGEHTIQLNGVGVDDSVRSTSLGVRIEDPESPTRERVVLATERNGGIPVVAGPAWLLLLAAMLGGGTTAWWFVAGRRRRDDEADAR